MSRITEKQLQAMVNRINRMTKSPIEPYTIQDGRGVANVGNYHLSGAYGGLSLHRMVSQSGGVADIFNCGHVPKRELYQMILAFIAGLDSCYA
ncbi:MAG: hypothetical protein RL535_1515 [Pseudomonadota bacterium]